MTLTAGLSLVVAFSSGSLLAPNPSDPTGEETAPAKAASSSCDELDLLEVPQGEFDPTSVPMADGIVWYGTWEDALAERDRTGKPLALHFGSPRRPKDFVCVPGAW